MNRSNIIRHPAKHLSTQQKKHIALQTINNKSSVTQIADRFDVSRKFIARQKNIAMDAVDQAFSESGIAERDILFYLPVTKSWIEQWVLCLILHARASYRAAKHVIKDLLDYDISTTSIYNIFQSAIQKAAKINSKQNLSNVKLSVLDEMFHLNKPVLAGIDNESLYCYLLSYEDHRDSDTWEIHLLDLQTQGLCPERAIGDDGAGLRAAHEIVFKGKPFDYDNFHLSKRLIDARLFFRNRHKTSFSSLIKEEEKLENVMKKGGPTLQSKNLEGAIYVEEKARYISETLDTLVSWMEHDVLSKAGAPLNIRKELYDFIVDELEKLATLHPHRIRPLCVTLRQKRDIALGFCEVLDNKFQMISNIFGCSLDTVWEMCVLLRCNIDSDNYAIRSIPLQDKLTERYDYVEDAVIIAMQTTERTSSMVENLNSRLSGYFFLRREIGNGYLNLLRFFLNHKPFERSDNPNREGKTPAEILYRKPHPHWLEMLDYTRFQQAA